MKNVALISLVLGMFLSCTDTNKEVVETSTKTVEEFNNSTNKVVLSSEIVWEKLNPARGDKSPQAGTI